MSEQDEIDPKLNEAADAYSYQIEVWQEVASCISQDAFIAGANWREQNPSREMVEKIVTLSRLMWKEEKFNFLGVEPTGVAYYHSYETVDEIMEELCWEK